MPYCSDPNRKGAFAGETPTTRTTAECSGEGSTAAFGSGIAALRTRFRLLGALPVLRRSDPGGGQRNGSPVAGEGGIVTLILTRGAAIGVLVPRPPPICFFMRSPLLGSVGQNGANGRADAKYAQRLLNQWRALADCLCLLWMACRANNTITATRDFQRAETPAWVDGLIEPGRKHDQANGDALPQLAQ